MREVAYLSLIFTKLTSWGSHILVALFDEDIKRKACPELMFMSSDAMDIVLK